MKARAAAVGLLVAGLALVAAAGPGTLRLPDGRTCFFSGARISIPVEIHGREEGPLRLSWSLHMAGALVARREVSVAVQEGQTTVHTLVLELPEARAGIPMEGLLRLAVADVRGQALDAIETPLRVFDRDPFQSRQRWLEAMRLHVYDPEGATAATFEHAGIPFRRIMNPAAFDTAAGGVLIIGEGLSLRDSRGLMEAALDAVQSSVSLLVLAPLEGEFRLPGVGGDGSGHQPATLSFHGRDVIAGLDKRLDTLRWAEDRDIVSRHFQIAARRSQPEIVVSEDQGWPWIALDWSDGRHARLCGFALMRDWEESPVPRYLLMAILEAIAKQKGREQ